MAVEDVLTYIDHLWPQRSRYFVSSAIQKQFSVICLLIAKLIYYQSAKQGFSSYQIVSNIIAIRYPLVPGPKLSLKDTTVSIESERDFHTKFLNESVNTTNSFPRFESVSRKNDFSGKYPQKLQFPGLIYRKIDLLENTLRKTDRLEKYMLLRKDIFSIQTSIF
ncbi:hypothetical protein FF38_09640 [Lucilia cuprina]|uniref:Uncharacterized protein n=1 Tax=Lucilia cuprina TaxID=7375 RepID=A0A0L0BX24_LUCCU|nr:hypothetical protein FF38_09640 [Lucilia cuprina]